MKTLMKIYYRKNRCVFLGNKLNIKGVIIVKVKEIVSFPAQSNVWFTFLELLSAGSY